MIKLPKAIKGKTISQYPVLMKEWIWEKNENSNPEKLLETSKKKVWWRCSEGHEYQMTIDSRTSGSKCPYCSGRRVLSGFNDFATTNPELLLEWDYEKNSAEGVEPTSVMRKNTAKVWWKCLYGHPSYCVAINKKQADCGCRKCFYLKNHSKVISDLFTMPKPLFHSTYYDFETESEITTREIQDYAVATVKDNAMLFKHIPEEYIAESMCLDVINSDCFNISRLTEEYISFELFPEAMRNNRTIIDSIINKYKYGAHNLFLLNRRSHNLLHKETIDYIISKIDETEDTNDENIKKLSFVSKQLPVLNSFNQLQSDHAALPMPIVQSSQPLSNDDIVSVHELATQTLVQKIYYVTDIHIEHHLFWDENLAKEVHSHNSTFMKAIIIQEWVKKKIQEMISGIDNKNDLLLIGGDVSDDIQLSKLFYDELKHQWHGTIISVLGNHELWNDSTPEDTVKEYKQIHNSYNDILLENELFVMYKAQEPRIISQDEILNTSVSELKETISRCTMIILGGLGYSGLNEEYNAERGLYYKAVTSIHEDKRRSALFRSVYEKVLKCSCGKQIIVLTHTQIEDWTSDPPVSKCIYVNGHTHQNKLLVTSDGVTVLSDNQLGYGTKKEYFPNSILPEITYLYPKWKLNSFVINKLWYDPFENNPDGIYTITSDEYKDFNHGRGITSNGCNYKGIIYMLKRNGTYMFLLKSSKSLCLLAGGKRSKLINEDVRYYYNNMDIYTNRIKEIISPYQNALQQLSDEVKKIGGNGKIHGCIVDIDYFNHIYLNPFDGKVTSYFAYDVQSRLPYSSIREHIEAKLPQLLSRYLQECDKDSIPHLELSSEYRAQEFESPCLPEWMFGTEIYAPSNDMRAVQYVWEKNVIRVWNEAVLSNSKNANLQNTQNTLSISDNQ